MIMKKKYKICIDISDNGSYSSSQIRLTADESSLRRFLRHVKRN